jgi:hypothetical protein
MLDTPKEMCVVKCLRFEDNCIDHNNTLTYPKTREKAFSKTTDHSSGSIFLTGYMDTNLKNPSGTTKIANCK